MANDMQSSVALLDERQRSQRAERVVELSVFLLLIIPSMVLSFFSEFRWTQGFVLTALSLISRQLGLAGLVFFFLWRNFEPVTAIGWTARDWPRQISLGILLFPLLFVAAAAVGGLFIRMGF